MVKELVELGLKEYLPENAVVSGDWDCPHCGANGKPSATEVTKKLVGWCKTVSQYHLYGVFECQACFGKYRHHIAFLPTEDPNGLFIRAAKRWLRRQGVEC